MAYENLKLAKGNVEVLDGYYYNVDQTSQLLFVKTADSTVAFTYPLSNPISNEVKTLCYDGYYWWTLEKAASSNIIRKWKIQNYIFDLQSTQTYANNGTDNFQGDTMSIEHYHYTVPVGGYAAHQTIIDIGDNTRLNTNDQIWIGPCTVPGDNYGKYELITVFQRVDGSSTEVELTGGLQNSYNFGDLMQSTTYVWLFNNYFGTTAGGGLYKIHRELPSGYVARYSGGTYQNVTASTFYNGYIRYVKGTLLLPIDPISPTVTPSDTNVKSMQMDNIQPDNITVIPVSDITIDEYNTIYRLQQGATYTINGTQSYLTWSTYNYQAATLRPFIRSINLTVNPGIMAADGASTTEVQATVRDQFYAPMAGVRVYLSDDSNDAHFDNGQLSPLPNENYKITGDDGKTVKVDFIAGTTEGEVTITAQANQPTS